LHKEGELGGKYLVCNNFHNEFVNVSLVYKMMTYELYE